MKVVATIGTTGTFARFSSLITELMEQRPETELMFQAGRGTLPPLPGALAFVPREQLLAHMREADLVVCHGGSGSVRDALRACGNVAVVPRRVNCGEGVVDDHQLDLSRALEARGLVRIVSSSGELVALLDAPRLAPRPRADALPAAVVHALRRVMRC